MPRGSRSSSRVTVTSVTRVDGEWQVVLPHLTVEATNEASRPRPRGGWRGAGPKGSHSHPVLSALCAGLGLAAPVPTSHGMSWVLSWVPINTPSCRGGDGCTEESQAHGEAEVGTPRPSHPEARNRGPGAQCQRQEDPYLLRPCPTWLGWAGLGVELPQGQRARGPKASCSEPGTGSLPMCPLCPQMPLPGGICASTKPWSSLRTRSRWVGPACGGWARARLRGPGDWAMAAPMVPLPFAILGPRLRLANRVGHVTVMAWPLVTVSLSPC